MTFVLGITGSIAMGKSATARMIERMVPRAVRVDADWQVHQMLDARGDAVGNVAEAFPETLRHTEAGEPYIDRATLAKTVFDDPQKLTQLEALLHPLVQEKNILAIEQATREGRPLVILDIPLLFETGADKMCDAVWVASAPAFVQRRRALKRKGMNRTKLRAALARQLPDAEKRARADAIIPTGYGKAITRHVLRRLLSRLPQLPQSA
jgi:dephospho-CoA kinase